MVLVFLAAGLTIARELVRGSSYIIRDRMLVQIAKFRIERDVLLQEINTHCESACGLVSGSAVQRTD